MRYSVLVRPVARALMPAGTRGHVVETLWCLGLAQRKRPPPDTRIRDRLTEEFREELAALGELLGRDLSSWSARSSP